MNKIQDIEVLNKKVLLRVDFNVPLKQVEAEKSEDQSVVENDKRIRESLPTIQYLLEKGVQKITIISHLGKPDGKKDEKYSMLPVANRLSKLLKIDKKFEKPENIYQISGKISLLENLRFDSGEEENNLEFAKKLANGQDIFVNDAFGTLHRAHASTYGVTEILPSFAGLLVQKEVEKMESLLKDIEKPFTVVLGGAKIADKLPVLKNLFSRANNFLIGGAIANTFLAARRHYLGTSLVEEDDFREANVIWQNLMDDPTRNLFLPKDLVFSHSFDCPDELKILKTSELLQPGLKEEKAVDIGPATIENFKKVINESKTIFWNGDMGISEVRRFNKGTTEIAKAILATKAHIIIGGGDTVAAVESLGLDIPSNVFLSTGGGATLEFLAGKQLPGLKALE